MRVVELNSKIRMEFLHPKYRKQFVQLNSDIFQRMVSAAIKRKVWKNPAGILHEKYGILLENSPAGYEVALFLLNLFPEHLLAINSSKKILFCQDESAYIGENFINNYPKNEGIIFEKKDANLQPNQRFPIHGLTIPTEELRMFADMQFRVHTIKIFSSQDSIYDYLALIHELGHCLYYFMMGIDSDCSWHVSFRDEKLFLKNFYSTWMDICTEEILPVSWYSAFYYPDFLANIHQRRDTLKFLTAINEEFAECFTAYIFGLVLDPWGETRKFSRMDFGEGLPSKKYQFIKHLFKGKIKEGR